MPGVAMSEDQPMSEPEAYAMAIGLLVRREHSARELALKLGAKGVESSLVDTVITRLIAERLQSDERYTEVYLRLRSDKGYGPQRIKAELRERGIDDALISAQFRQAEEAGELDWYGLAAAAYAKKYGGRPVEEIKERAKRTRFLQYRGFDHEQIAAAIDSEN